MSQSSGINRIPDDARREADEVVRRFNQAVVQEPALHYVAHYRGPYLYLGRMDFGELSPICRLQYTGTLDRWEFAIYKHSDGRYDPDECWFPGSQYLDGTIEGALRAGLEAYPP